MNDLPHFDKRNPGMKKLVIAAILQVFAIGASAQVAPEVIADLKAKYPNTQFREINPTPIPNVFEVVMGQNVAYVDRSGRYFFFGRLFDMQQQQDLTEPKVAKANAVDVNGLPLRDAMKLVKGNGKRTIYIFSDPDCPFCKQLEKNLSDVTDVTIYTFLFPIASLHPDARRKAISVWCSPNPAQAWDGLMTRGAEPPKVDCPNPIDRNVALAERLGINGTPTLISGDGRKLPGAAPAARIESWLNQTPVAQASK